MVILKGSAKKAKSTFKDPIGTHEKAVKIWRRSSVLFESKSKNTPTLTAKDPPTMSVAKIPAFGSPRIRPKRKIKLLVDLGSDTQLVSRNSCDAQSDPVVLIH
jgi:hypothetical protein